MVEALSSSMRDKRWAADVPLLETARAGASLGTRSKMQEVVKLPLLKAVVGTHGLPGDRRSSLRTIPAMEVIGVPAPWCPNPSYTSLLRVKGRSMEPLLRHGDILAVDSFEIERADLYGKIVIAVNEERGMCVSHLRRYENLDVLEAENRQYEPVVLSKASGWRIIGRVLWWISAAP